jgi:hypothetical protein
MPNRGPDTLQSPLDSATEARAWPSRKVILWLWALAMASIAVHVCLRPNTHTLYKVYAAGGARWLASENVYPKVDEYIYSPFVAALFAPLTLLPNLAAGLLWRCISLAVYAGAFAAWLRSTRAVPEEQQPLAWLLLLPLSAGDLYNGQANPVIIGLLMLGILYCRRERWMMAAICVAVTVYFKVYPVAIGLLLAELHPRRFPLRLVLALAGIFLLSLVMQRPAYALEQYANWIHSLGQDPRRTLDNFGTYRDFWLLLKLLRVPISLQGWAAAQCLSGCALAVYLWMVHRRGAAADLLDFLLLTLGACWMLLFGPATESATYVIITPSLALATVRWRMEAGTGRYFRASVACYCLLGVSQMFSSWARHAQSAYTHMAQPAGTIILAVAALIYGWKRAGRSDTGLARSASVD